MFSDSLKCPDRKSMEDYFLGKLDSRVNREMEEHFYTCDHCVEEARKMLHAVTKLRIIKANPLIGSAWEKYGDKIEEFKCAESVNESTREYETRNRKFKITLRSIEKNRDLSLLEIEVLDKSIRGNILIYIDGLRKEIEIDNNGLACTVVKSDIDIRKLIIRNNNH